MGRACSTNGGEVECIQDIGGKPEGKRPLGIISHWILERYDMWYGLDRSGPG
jgi:hypothetical protein